MSNGLQLWNREHLPGSKCVKECQKHDNFCQPMKLKKLMTKHVKFVYTEQ